MCLIVQLIVSSPCSEAGGLCRDLGTRGLSALFLIFWGICFSDQLPALSVLPACVADQRGLTVVS